MEITIVIILVIFGMFCTFLSASISYLSYDDLNNIIKLGTNKSVKLNNLKSNFEETNHAFFLWEIISYIGGALALYLADMRYFLFNNFWLYLFVGFTIFFFIIFLTKSIAFTLGKRYANPVSLVLSNLAYSLTFLMKPMTSAMKFIDNKFIGKQPEEISRDELAALIDSSYQDNSIKFAEYSILKSILHFSKVLVSDVMTPRTVIFSCNADMTVGETIKLIDMQMYSRFPIWEGDFLDNGVIGYVMSKDVLQAALAGKNNMLLKDFKREVYIIPENAELDVALDMFLRRRQHLFVVVDEHGGIEGLLTMEDVLETILGVEIVDEADKVIDLREYAKQKRDKRTASLHGKTD